MALPKKKTRRSSQIGRLGLECSFLKYDDDENHITYTIQLKCQANETAWNISKRYNEFYRLNTELQKDRNFRGIKLPNFPGKAISFTDASKKELAEERMQHLEIYLNGLISRTVFLSSPAVRAFLNMPISVRDLAIILSTRQNAALKQGYMQKKGELNKKWRKRWFVLQPNYILKYYKQESSHDPQGSIDISTIQQVQMKNTTQDKKYSFTLVGKQRRWFLACENETEKREWTRMFMRLRDTKAPFKNDIVSINDTSIHDSKYKQQQQQQQQALPPHGQNRKSFNLGPHFKRVTQVKWCPTIPGILATGSEDESLKIWQTHLLDHTLVPAEYDQIELDKILGVDQNDNDNEEKEEEEEEEEEEEDNDKKASSSTYPLHAIEFQPISEYKTSGKVTCLEWSPDGSMLVASLRKEIQDNNSKKRKYGYFIQCFDLHAVLGQYTTDWDDFGGDHNKYDFDVTASSASAAVANSNGHINENEDANNYNADDDDSKTKIFTLQDHPSRLVFSADGRYIYMAMDIDPNSEENEKRRPAFLVYLDLTQNQLHRCKTVDRIIDHQTEFIVGLAMNNARNIMVVATSTHRNIGRIIAWDIEKNQTRIIERKGSRISSLLFTDDDSWLIIGRNNGKLQFWNSYNENNKKLKSYYKQKLRRKERREEEECEEEEEEESAVEAAAAMNESICFFELQYEETIHSGPVFNITTSNGVLISSAKPTNLEYESFFIDNIIWDIRLLMNIGKRGKLVARLHNVNDSEKDITRLLDLSPVTPRHVREGGGPGTLLAASGDRAIYCHNMMDILLDALSMGTLF